MSARINKKRERDDYLVTGCPTNNLQFQTDHNDVAHTHRCQMAPASLPLFSVIILMGCWLGVEMSKLVRSVQWKACPCLPAPHLLFKLYNWRCCTCNTKHTPAKWHLLLPLGVDSSSARSDQVDFSLQLSTVNLGPALLAQHCTQTVSEWVSEAVLSSSSSSSSSAFHSYCACHWLTDFASVSSSSSLSLKWC